MTPVEDHPLRYPLVNELHARPFPTQAVPGHAVYLALKEPKDAANRDRAHDYRHLADLLERFGGAKPTPGATHHSCQLGRHELKWESHSEFVAYLAVGAGVSERPFDPVETEIFPADWIEDGPGRRLAAIQVRVEEMPEDPARIETLLDKWFVPESLSCAQVLEGAAVIAGDFRIDPAGQMRFAVFVRPGTGAGRVGRIVQRLCEIETYRAMSMLGLGRARSLSERLSALDPELSAMVSSMTESTARAEETLHQLLRISADLEALAVQHSFRFGATAAYEAIVHDRIALMRETRFMGRQKFSEFMLRRYDPAMRTVKSAEARLNAMLERAARAGELLRTRVDVERQAQSQKLLANMDRRADMQLRLQHTVEGLSVVAISYYALGLATYLAYPVAESFGISKSYVMAGLAPLCVAGVWASIWRIRRRMEAQAPH